MTGPSEDRTSEQTAVQQPVEPTVSTAPPPSLVRRWWSSIPSHLGPARTSTVALGVIFVALFALYLQVRPATTAPPTAGNTATTTPAPTTAPATTTPPPTTESREPTRTPEETTPTEAPTTTEDPEDTGTEEPTRTVAPTTPAPTTTAPTTATSSPIG